MVNLALQTQFTLMFTLYFWQLDMVDTLDLSTVLLVCEGLFLSVLIVFMMVACIAHTCLCSHCGFH